MVPQDFRFPLIQWFSFYFRKKVYTVLIFTHILKNKKLAVFSLTFYVRIFF